MSGTRLAAGGLIDRDRSLSFSFDGRAFRGHPGDTLASALLANGVSLVGRSFKYHRPRGIHAAGSDEPNALLRIGRGAARSPNTRATMVELRAGLTAQSQNHRGSLRWDAMAANDLLWPFLSAGFYYKTFMWPRGFWERVYEPAIRASAGLGRLSGMADPGISATGWRHADLLVIGAGPAGLMAALTAARAGLRVILADEDFRPGGRLNAESLELGGGAGSDWAARSAAELADLPNVRLMPRTTVWGVFDHGQYGALELCPEPQDGQPQQVLWRIRARRAVLASGATERAIAFGANDRPGIMLAGAVRAYLNRWGVAAGRRVAVFGNNAGVARTAADLRAAGVDVAAELDTRAGDRIVDTRGRHGLRQIRLSDGRRIAADCLAVSGGWSPNIHLTCHHRGRPVWRADLAAFVPGGDLPPGMRVAGAATGACSLSEALREGAAAGAEAAEDLGRRAPRRNLPEAEDDPRDIAAFWHVGESRGRAWVDLQNDVTTKDIVQAQAEGFRAVEHVKRYTTLGMATDQGKTSNILGLAVLAEATGRSIPQTGTTIFRPPYTPVPIAALAGSHRGGHFRPVRRTPSHDWAAEEGAVFVEAGPWLRAQYFPREREKGWRETVAREVLTTRRAVGICDVSTLGKIDVQGRDAADFVNRIYANGFARLAVGRVRYGLMLREDGFAFDDGTCARLGETQFVVTTTTAKAGEVFRHMEFCRQCLFPDLDVHLVSITDGWAQYSVAGPMARALLQRVVDAGHDLSDAAFPFMACGTVTLLGGHAARLFRVSFSGELAYELAVPARYGDALIRALMAAGRAFDAVAYGTEALSVMRIEKGHPAGPELDGRTTAGDLGLGAMTAKKSLHIGAVAARREVLQAANRAALVGLVPVAPKAELSAGAHLLPLGAPAVLERDAGWISSAAWSPTLGHAVALGFVSGGGARHGETLVAWDGIRGRKVPVRVVPPHFYDPEGVRQRV